VHVSSYNYALALTSRKKYSGEVSKTLLGDQLSLSKMNKIEINGINLIV